MRNLTARPQPGIGAQAEWIGVWPGHDRATRARIVRLEVWGHPDCILDGRVTPFTHGRVMLVLSPEEARAIAADLLGAADGPADEAE